MPLPAEQDNSKKAMYGEIVGFYDIAVLLLYRNILPRGRGKLFSSSNMVYRLCKDMVDTYLVK